MNGDVKLHCFSIQIMLLSLLWIFLLKKW